MIRLLEDWGPFEKKMEAIVSEGHFNIGEFTNNVAVQTRHN